MADLKVDAVALTTFATALGAESGVVGAECSATDRALGSGVVQDALGNVSPVLTVLDRALADGASALALGARSARQSWASADASISMQAV